MTDNRTEDARPQPRSGPGGPARDAHTCEVWWARPAQVPAELVSVLSPAERERRAATVRQQDRDRFTAAAALLRLALGARLGIPPARVPIDRTCPDCPDPHGRPRLPGSLGMDCSVARSADQIAVAVSSGRTIGVDVEDVVEQHELDDLAVTALTPRERAAVARRPRRSRPRAVARLWTAKEAVLKATGDGLRICPGSVEIHATRDELRLLGLPRIPALARGAVLHRLRPAAAVATLAALGPEPLTVREYPAADLYRNLPHIPAA
ncbi:4'-phosphopantetheinyl transferase family protein [Kitasatospora sp. NPDC056138]|uniref:4'-phosphopantetheinyl transferase family protein n=1 Tax=Kitasatospora sp. NPDC056138 TaxID=3345724 RepID=UPI0035DC41FB